MGAIAIFTLMMGLLGAGISAASQQHANEINAETAERINQQNIEYSREAAETANEQTRQNYWELYSPQAKVQQYKDAGLNPALMYTMGGVSGSGQAAAQGAQPNLTVPYVNPLMNNNMIKEMSDLLTKGLGGELTESETENTNTDTKKKEQEIKNLQSIIELNNAEIDKIVSEMNLNNVRIQNEAFEGIIKQYEIEITKATWQDKITITKETLKQIQKKTEEIEETIKGLKIENDNKQKLYDAEIKKMAAETSLLWKKHILIDIENYNATIKAMLAGSEVKLNYTKRQQIEKETEKITSLTAKINAEIKLIEEQQGKIKLEKITEIIGWIEQISGLLNNKVERMEKTSKTIKNYSSIIE